MPTSACDSAPKWELFHRVQDNSLGTPSSAPPETQSKRREHLLSLRGGVRTGSSSGSAVDSTGCTTNTQHSQKAQQTASSTAWPPLLPSLRYKLTQPFHISKHHLIRDPCGLHYALQRIRCRLCSGTGAKGQNRAASHCSDLPGKTFRQHNRPPALLRPRESPPSRRQPRHSSRGGQHTALGVRLCTLKRYRGKKSR